MIVYKATNQLNGKIYIGATVKSFKKRVKGHTKSIGRGSRLYFHREVRKYGIENFKWEVICICPNIESLYEQEQYYIALYDSMQSGYNNTSGGLNCVFSERIKKQMKESCARFRDKDTQLIPQLNIF